MAISLPPTPLAGGASGNGKITREAVLAAALSMSRLACGRDRDPMILYRHAPGNAATLPACSAADWSSPQAGGPGLLV